MKEKNRRSLVELSIIIVVYNNKHITGNCIKSISRFIDYSYEIIIVDNNSSDDYEEYLFPKYSNIIYIRNNSNLGYGSAVNVGVKEANGNYLLILNNDIELIDNSINKLLDYFESSFNDVIITGKVLNEDFTPQLNCERFPSFISEYLKYGLFQIKNINLPLLTNRGINTWDYDKFEYVDWISGCLMLVSKENFNKVNGFDINFFMFYEDVDLCHRLNKIGVKSLYHPNTRFTHLKGHSTAKLNKFKGLELSFKSCLFYLKKYNSNILVNIWYYALLLTWFCLFLVLHILKNITFSKGKRAKIIEKTEMLKFLIKCKNIS